MHAIPAFHTAYLGARRAVLQSVLENYHDGVVDVSDSVIALRSRNRSIIDVDNYDTIVELLDGHRRSHYKSPANASEAVDLLRLHEVAMWWLRDFEVNMKCPYWMKMSQWLSIKPLKLSSEERLRFFRGFYRLETWRNIFSDVNVLDENENPSEGFYQMVDMFFLSIPPWETEEVACFWWVMYLRIVSVFHPCFEYDSDKAENITLRGPHAVQQALKNPGEFKAGLKDGVDYGMDEGEILFRRGFPFEKITKFTFPGRNSPFHYPAEQYEGKSLKKFKKRVKALPMEKRPSAYWLREISHTDNSKANFFYQALAQGCHHR